jgi:hypothetical protein
MAVDLNDSDSGAEDAKGLTPYSTLVLSTTQRLMRLLDSGGFGGPAKQENRKSLPTPILQKIFGLSASAL